MPLGLATCWRRKDTGEGHKAPHTLCMSSMSSSLRDRVGLGQTYQTGESHGLQTINDWYEMRTYMSSRSMTLMATSLPFSRSNLQIAYLLSLKGKAFAREGTAVAH